MTTVRSEERISKKTKKEVVVVVFELLLNTADSSGFGFEFIDFRTVA